MRSKCSDGCTLTSKKTTCVLFSRRASGFSFKLHRPSCNARADCLFDLVTNVDHHRFLGLHIDSDLHFTSHVHHVCSKLRSGVATLSRLRTNCSIETKRLVFHASVGSHVAYMLPLYGVAVKSILSRADVLQKRAVKASLGLAARTSSEYIYKAFRILPVEV